jgi:hypothetical protein
MQRAPFPSEDLQRCFQKRHGARLYHRLPSSEP